MLWKCVHGNAPAYLCDLCIPATALSSRVVSICDLQRLALYWFHARTPTGQRTSHMEPSAISTTVTGHACYKSRIMLTMLCPGYLESTFAWPCLCHHRKCCLHRTRSSCFFRSDWRGSLKRQLQVEATWGMWPRTQVIDRSDLKLGFGWSLGLRMGRSRIMLTMLCPGYLTMPLPPQKVLLTNTQNKIQLIDLIDEALKKDKDQLSQCGHKLVITGRDQVPTEIIKGIKWLSLQENMTKHTWPNIGNIMASKAKVVQEANWFDTPCPKTYV